MSNRYNGADLMFLLKEGVSLIIRRLSFNSDRNFYFPIRIERKSPNNERLVSK